MKMMKIQSEINFESALERTAEKKSPRNKLSLEHLKNKAKAAKDVRTKD